MTSRGIGILSWRAHDGLDDILAGYGAAGLWDLFDEKLIWFQEESDADRALADRHGLPYGGTPDNQGILGGFRNLAAAMSSDIILLLENDLPLIEGHEEVARQIEAATEMLANGEAQVVRLRHRKQPGQKFDTLGKYLRYHGEGAMPYLRRTIRVGKAKRLAGTALYSEEYPDAMFPDFIQARDDGGWLISSACLPWTNQSIMVRREFLLDEIIAYAEAHPSPRRVNGFPDIEKEWNTPRWRRSGWRVGATEGLFTHERP
ncbi:hypothetical protein [Parvularcula marina]|uniref:Glycosyltransferase n=1 Tax=Parvularcula marina TaxID=2292771 RepID=A0A371RIP0_9PROT|nr:hypothetical protein [Parvularcula marina]RFB05312.1 hypothetical protein DX908_08625 [Parvularcula marina]